MVGILIVDFSDIECPSPGGPTAGKCLSSKEGASAPRNNGIGDGDACRTSGE